MTAKMGRPIRDNPKSKKLTVRVNKETFEMLEKYCESNNVNIAEAIRHGIKHLEVGTKK